MLVGAMDPDRKRALAEEVSRLLFDFKVERRLPLATLSIAIGSGRDPSIIFLLLFDTHQSLVRCHKDGTVADIKREFSAALRDLGCTDADERTMRFHISSVETFERPSRSSMQRRGLDVFELSQATVLDRA